MSPKLNNLKGNGAVGTVGNAYAEGAVVTLVTPADAALENKRKIPAGCRKIQSEEHSVMPFVLPAYPAAGCFHQDAKRLTFG